MPLGKHTFPFIILESLRWRGSFHPKGKQSAIRCQSSSAKHEDALAICWRCGHVQRTVFLSLRTGQEPKCVKCRPAKAEVLIRGLKTRYVRLTP